MRPLPRWVLILFLYILLWSQVTVAQPNLGVTGGAGEKRAALAIGNNDYQRVRSREKAVNDARWVGKP